MSETILCARALSWSVGERNILWRFDLDVMAGQVMGLVGPNGSGKSTAFRLVVGDLTGAGTVTLRGLDLGGMGLAKRSRAGIGYLPQGGASLRGLTAAGQLALLAELHGLRGGQARTRVEETLADVGLSHRAGVRVEVLSGGERRRLEVGGVLLGRFAVMVLDEPFSAVEPLGVATLATAFRALCKAGTAVLLADHARETLSVCDTAVLVVRGEVLARGPAEALRRDPVVHEAYLGRGWLSDANLEPRI